ncbi:predicted protein [Nematostella vectensis]|uniref:Phosphatidylinositol N-acetylglucosaminyltransferase subunit C n=1 Tax=Nematostella vectensis TaxID=45351 RepID=A7SU73_NEMVE|nr:phosphatidylinositol N-acetylglucosaminyltransferase subunit C [Nematostella vectensis]EDO32752.1 predicted protein [Nematostella vectensis]|eukprot:XP_001624852.1 predicted protein [Nematostella vectensis]
MKKRRPWRKVLYEDQDYPDNHVDKSFLEEMKKNLHTRTYKLRDVIWESGVVSQQISSVCIFASLFVYMEQDNLSPSTLLMISSALTLSGYLLYDLMDHGEAREKSGRTRMDDVKSMLLVLGCVLFFSPVLKNLTDTISTDTIYAMTAVMLGMNLLFHDYGTSAAIVSNSASLNSATFASVCLASRLPTAWHAFVTVIFAMQLFALLPALRQQIKAKLGLLHVLFTCCMVGVSAFLLYPLSLLMASLFVMIILDVTLLCPLWLVKLQDLKNNIHGPWDEAVITE